MASFALILLMASPQQNCSDFLQLYNKQKNVLTKRKKNNFLIHTIHIKSIQTLQLKDAISVTNIGI